jgi:hypothetical protein
MHTTIQMLSSTCKPYIHLRYLSHVKPNPADARQVRLQESLNTLSYTAQHTQHASTHSVARTPTIWLHT